ncbi:hypothetical protein FGS76_17185 [Alloalcanivorax gelatiniphagus]|uniref:Type II toxin-antitoxin system RelE/ParE family toxin n=1 Tax=Alloalcanivorax gelatiniphagus TaxID=1194167 RepID=A0ABY2XH81_9GAMM|nr:hypothetical protein FGS76_17185 [Alloalcanivorax gelatiniphagus]
MKSARKLPRTAAWYEKEDPGLGGRLVDAFAHAVRLLEEPNPPLTPVGGKAGSRGAKRLLLHHFPFSFITLSRGSTTVVIAFAHHSRKPGYWIDRV